jgi:hypothetical protein
VGVVNLCRQAAVAWVRGGANQLRPSTAVARTPPGGRRLTLDRDPRSGSTARGSP